MTPSFINRNGSVFQNPAANYSENLRSLWIPERRVRHFGINLKRFVRRSTELIERNELPVAYDSISAAFDQQRRSMQARPDFPTPAKDDALHIEQITEADVLIGQRVHAAPGNELRIAGTFLKALADQTDYGLAVREHEVRHQAHTFQAQELTEVKIESQRQKDQAGKLAAVSFGIVERKASAHTVAQQKNLRRRALLL